MARRRDPLRCLIERVAQEHPHPAYFVGNELDDWSPGAEAAFVMRGLLVATARATSAVCEGCESACHEPVIVQAKLRGGASVAFIQCNEAPDLGRIPVRLERLRRFQASLALVANFLANALKLGAKRLKASRDGVRIGSTRGRYGPRDVGVACAEGRLFLKVGQQEQDLGDLTSWVADEIWIDTDQIRRMANRKDRAAAVHSGREVSTSPSKDRDTKTAQRNSQIFQHAERLRRQSKNSKSWTQVAEEIAQMPFIASPDGELRPITADTVRRILTRRARY